MITVNVNLIGFSSNKSVGTLIYTRRLFRQVYKMNLHNIKFIFYAQHQFDFSDFCMPDEVDIVRVPNIKSPLLRRLYEHTLFRFKLKKAGYVFTPYLTLPFLFSPYKQIVTIHDMVPFVVPHKYGKLKLAILKVETLLATKLANTIVTVSSNSKKDICRITGVDEDKVKVVYNFITKEEPVIRRKNNVNLIDFGISKKYFINVSTLQPGKNIERMVRAFNLFLEDHPDYQLCIVGNKGWGFSPIYKIVKDLKLEDSVIFTGYANDETLSALYENCFGVVYVSLYEGFGIPPLEGFYHGKAVVSSNNSSLPEVVGDAGIYVDPYDERSIAAGLNEFILKKNDLEEKIGIQISKFTPETITSYFLSIFNSPI